MPDTESRTPSIHPMDPRRGENLSPMFTAFLCRLLELPGDDPEPGGEVAPAPEACHRRREGLYRRSADPPDPRDAHQAPRLFVLARSRPSSSETLSAVAKTSNTSSSYAFRRAPSGSNIAEREATVTGKHSLMYSTCNLMPATARSIGR